MEEIDHWQNMFIIRIILDLKFLNLENNIYEELLEMSENSHFTEVSCFLFHNLGKYTSCYSKYFKSINSIIRKRIFVWLKNIFEF